MNKQQREELVELLAEDASDSFDLKDYLRHLYAERHSECSRLTDAQLIEEYKDTFSTEELPFKEQ